MIKNYPVYGRVLALCFLFQLFVFSSFSQEKHIPRDTTVGIYVNPQTNDTIPAVTLDAVLLEGKMLPKWRKYYKEWTRLRNAVYVTYPYALAAARVMNQINAELAGVTDPNRRKAIIRSHEAEMKQNFTSKVTNLSVYQGKILMKLIRRQTGNNCYEIIREYKGDLTAIFWQSVALVFGSSLKQDYDPFGEDQALEAIVQEVETMYGNRTAYPAPAK